MNSLESRGDSPYAYPISSKLHMFELRGVGEVRQRWRLRPAWVRRQRAISNLSAAESR